MRTKQSSFQNVNLYDLSETPAHLRIDRAKLDDALARRRDFESANASTKFQSVEALAEYHATRDRLSRGWALAPEAVEPTTESASIADHEETWKAQEAAALQARRIEKDCPSLGEASEPRRSPGKNGRFRGVLASIPRWLAEKRKAKLERKRMIGGHQGLPPNMRKRMTIGEQAVAVVIQEQFRRFGRCELCNAHIAAMAGVSKSLVGSVKRFMKLRGFMVFRERRVCGNRSLPTIIRIVSDEWLAWIRKGPRGGWSQKVNNNKSLTPFFVRPCNSEVVKSSDDPDPHTFQGAALCRESG